MPTFPTEWFKSSYSQEYGDCVQARRQTTGMDIRDSKNPRGMVVGVGAAAWVVFLGGADSRERLRWLG